ncbi:hypothetical protein EV196_105347 [Mariniflexile fucanivorans]|uniref:DUF6268 domain-containing protein n=1 Tax=Mariniflexile fucanivorans TaxID=264023 RepID=A0A4R1RHY2_9FLAO|nr:DUF6268 family outer membrane beta-barrel protein [Mariniflexile fucanivorans]TCL65681.1 hypothetical protein EV196_105347 [Mariniflexile fucanivorans]
MKKIIFTLIVLNIFWAYAQNDTTAVYCVPVLKDLPIGKGLVIEYQNVSNISMETIDKTGNFTNTKSNIKSNTHFLAKLEIPVVNKDYLRIMAGLKYNKEEFHFNDAELNPFYKNLEDRGLKSIGMNVSMVKPTKSKKFWVLRASADLNGDFKALNSFSDYLKFSISPALGWKVNDNFSYALGASYNYRFGDPLIVPVVALNSIFNEKWDMEAILPLFIRLRYQYNSGLIWRNTVELDGASYKLDNLSTEFDSYTNLHLHRSDIQFSTRVEKKLIGWLWAASEIGFRENLTYNLTNSNKSYNDIIFDNTLKTALLFNVSLFISPRK